MEAAGLAALAKIGKPSKMANLKSQDYSGKACDIKESKKGSQGGKQ